jgi:subfamily B ATP-binding cassette protein MsbA
MTAVHDPTESASAVPTPAGEQAPASSMKVYARLLGYTRPYLGYFALSIAGFAIAGACKAGLASVLKYFIDGLAAPDAPIATGLAWLDALDLVVAIPLMIVVIALWRGPRLLSWATTASARVSLGLIHDLRVKLFGSLLALPNRYLRCQHNSGHLDFASITYNVSMVTGAATDAVKVLVPRGSDGESSLLGLPAVDELEA